MPAHIFTPFHPDELAAAQMAPPSAFSRSMPLMRIPVSDRSAMYDKYGPGCLIEDETRLYDLRTDPARARPCEAVALGRRPANRVAEPMAVPHAPPEAFSRLALDAPGGEGAAATSQEDRPA